MTVFGAHAGKGLQAKPQAAGPTAYYCQLCSAGEPVWRGDRPLLPDHCVVTMDAVVAGYLHGESSTTTILPPGYCVCSNAIARL